MDVTVVTAIIAGGASLAAGIMGTVLSKLRSDIDAVVDKHLPRRDSKRAELKATTRALHESLQTSARSKRRLGILATVGVAFVTVSILELLLVDHARDGQLHLVVTIGAFVLAGVLAVLVLSIVLLAYRSIGHQQQTIERQLEQLNKAHRLPQEHAGQARAHR